MCVTPLAAKFLRRLIDTPIKHRRLSIIERVSQRNGRMNPLEAVSGERVLCKCR
jgi:hypothetical protein